MKLRTNNILYLFLCLTLFISPCFAGDIMPADLAVPVPEISKCIDNQGGQIRNSTNAEVMIASDRLNQSVEIVLQDYTSRVREIHLKNPDVLATVLGAVRIICEVQEDLALRVKIPLIRHMSPGVQLEVVKPNLTGSAWASTALTAIVDQNGYTAIFETTQTGAYAVYNPEHSIYLEQNLRKRKSQSKSTSSRNNETWGLHAENQQSPDKIPLILVHGDNSYKEDKDRWEDFLDWVSEHSEFDKTYEIWRFHHNTDELIGFDGKSGNAAEFGDAIHKQFGTDRRILLLAHSRGGLVSRAYMCKYNDGNEGDRVIGLVTLATPHHGSPGAVPDWGLDTVRGKFKDTELADIFYGLTYDEVVNVADLGTMGLAWDNFDGPENGIKYTPFSLESRLGNEHVLSVLDANMKNPQTDVSETDFTLYIPDRAFGTLEELNADSRYFGKIIAYAGYYTDLGIGGHDPFNWLNFSFSDHIGLEMAAHIMANMESKVTGAAVSQFHFMANDGMVPIQSALLLKKDSAAEPVYDAEKDDNWFTGNVYEINLKEFFHRLRFRKSVLCPDYDHLHMVEGKGGLLNDKSDYWDHVGTSLNELAELDEQDSQIFTPETETISDSLPPFSAIVSGSNCFIETAGW